MKLKNSPWKVIETEDQLVVTDNEDWDVFAVLIDEEEQNHLPGSVDDERAKADAIAALPDILLTMESLNNASIAGNEEAFDEAALKLTEIYRTVARVELPI